jgi:alkyl hydroperoxide reductase subunit AhpF
MKNNQIPILFAIILLSNCLNLNHQSLNSNAHEAKYHYDVIVVGAGFAGTSAAS